MQQDAVGRRAQRRERGHALQAELERLRSVQVKVVRDVILPDTITVQELANRMAARTPDVIKASRKKRIAAGSGTSVQEINRLLKQFDDMSTMMKRMNKLGQKGLMRQGMGALMPKQHQRRPY